MAFGGQCKCKILTYTTSSINNFPLSTNKVNASPRRAVNPHNSSSSASAILHHSSQTSLTPFTSDTHHSMTSPSDCLPSIASNFINFIEPPTELNWIQKGNKRKHFGKLNCLYTNATSLNTTKLNELIALASVDKPHIIFITETWFSEFSIATIPNYKTFRVDRPTHGGGVAIFARLDLQVVELSLPHKHTEQLWLQINTPHEIITIGCIYRPPNSTRTPSESLQIVAEICNNLKIAKNKSKNGGLLVTGDFNFPNIIWGPDHYTEILGSLSTPCSAFIDTLNDLTLSQHVHFPTFVQSDGTCKNTLDLVISESPERIDNVTQQDQLGQSSQSHLCISFNLMIANRKGRFSSASNKLNYKI